jgi:hypothetical protein
MNELLFGLMIDEWANQLQPRSRDRERTKVEQVLPTGQSFTLIHFVFQVNPERVACMPNMIDFGRTKYHPVVRRSNATAAVTCFACKKTDQYKKAKGNNG